MKIFNMTNIPGFINVVDQCKGAVRCKRNDGSTIDLKDPSGVLDVVRMMNHSGCIEELDIHADLNEDRTLLVRYAADAGIN